MLIFRNTTPSARITRVLHTSSSTTCSYVKLYLGCKLGIERWFRILWLIPIVITIILTIILRCSTISFVN